MSTTTLGKGARGNSVVWIAILAVLAVLGVVAWITQLTQGMAVTGINQAVVWGLYIGTFFLLAGTASGLLILAALGALGVIPGDQHRRDLLVASVAAYIGAGIVILMDIGHPERVLQFLTSPRFFSPFVWDFYALALAAAIGLIWLLLLPKARWMAWLAGIAGLLVILAEGLLMSVNVARPVWHSPLTPVLFFVEAAVTSCALVYLVLRDEKFGNFLLSVLRVALTALLILILLETITVMYAGETDARAAMGLLLTGNLAMFFWLQIIVGILVPILILALKAPGKTLAIIAAILAILGVLLAKLDLLVAGQAYPMLQEPVSYTPTLVEVGGVLGAVAIGALLYAVGRRVFPSKG